METKYGPLVAEVLGVSEYGNCEKSCGNSAEELHPCPYQAELYDNNEDTCNCCDECSYQCAMGI